MFLNRGRFKNISDINTLNSISSKEPESKILFNSKFIDKVVIANHLNGGMKYNNAPLISYNSLGIDPGQVELALVQCFYGTDELQVEAVKFALTIMSMSNPRPKEWIFVEAQKDEKDAKFKWVSRLGIRYVFKRIWNEKQNYFIKEQLWNIGAYMTISSRLVFVDADVAYCQTDWLKFVDGTFNEGAQLFQPHAWSWRASEPNGQRDMHVNSLNILESFAHRRKMGIPLTELWGHTGYDIALTREHYNAIHGFYSLVGTGGDFLMWSLLGKEEGELPEWHPYRNLIKKIEEFSPIPHVEIGCSELACFHNHHGSSEERKRKYNMDMEEIKNSKCPEKYVTNNFNFP